MLTYKLFRVRNNKLYPLYVNRTEEMEIGKPLFATIGEKVDDTHVKSSLGALSLRPGFHSTAVPFTDWIGKRQNGKLVQRKDTVWCECEVTGAEQTVTAKNGLRTLPDTWYYFRTNCKQKDPWIISKNLTIIRKLDCEEVKSICRQHGITAQEIEE